MKGESQVMDKVFRKIFTWILPALVVVLIMPVMVNAATGKMVKESGDQLPVGGFEPAEARYLTEDIEVVNATDRPQKIRSLSKSNEDSVFIKGASMVGYNSLSKGGQKNLYNEFNDEAIAFMNASQDLTTTKINSTSGPVDEYVVARISFSDLDITDDEAKQVFYAYDYDHPGYYWISNTFWIFSNDSICLCTEKEFASVNERTRLNKLINDGVKDYISLAENGADDLDKISIVHDLIVDAVDYAYKEGTRTPESAKWAHSVVGVFDDHKHVVCEGYADTFSLIMNCMGIPNYYIVGTADSSGNGGGGGHAWNAVSADKGSTYMYADLTWDDPTGFDGYYYKWFGMPKSDFEASHYRYESSGTGSNWLYDISGNISDDFAGTYYSRANLYCDSTDSVSEKAQTGRTRAARVGSCVTYLVPDRSVIGEIALFYGQTSYYYWTVSYKGTEYFIYKHTIADSEISVAQATLTDVDDAYVYDGSAVEPEPTVTLDGVKLIKDRNYTTSYENNSSVNSNASVSVTGKGKFKETASKTFAITDNTPVVDSGTCGETLTWKLTGSDSDRTLTVSGTGSMTDFVLSGENSAPWSSKRDSIKTIIVEDGATSLGSAAFYNCTKVSSITLPDSLKTINNDAFMNCEALGEIKLPEGLESLGSNAFKNCKSLSSIDVCCSCKCREAIETEYQNLVSIVHKYGSVIAKIEATCTSDGMEAHYKCSGCSKLFVKDGDAYTEKTAAELKIPASHELTSHAAVAAKCEAAGNSAYWSCPKCGKYFSDEGKTEIAENSWVIDAKGHTYGSLIAKIEATCTADGMEAHYECSDCSKLFVKDGDVYTEKTAGELKIPASHELTSHAAVAAKCETAGNSAYWSCSKCSKYFSDEGKTEIAESSWVVDALGHDWDDGTVTDAPTYETTGTMLYKCKREGCNAERTETIGKLEHSFSDEWTSDDDHHWHACTEENCEEKDSYAEHQWVERITQQPSCTKNGVKTYTCSVCGKKKTEEIIASGHEENDFYTRDKAPTCVEEGQESIHCKKCGMIIEGTKRSIPKTDHRYGAWQTTTAATTEHEGVSTRTCSVCGDKQTKSIPKLTPAPSPSPSPAVTVPSVPVEIVDLPAVKISKPVAGKKNVTVRWAKPSKKNLNKIQGIEIHVTGPGVDKYAAAGKKKTSKKIGGLAPKQKYTVQVRSYGYINGVKHVSGWKSKSVKLK